MTIQDITSIISLVLAILSILIAVGALVISSMRLITAEKTLQIEVRKWNDELENIRRGTRLEFLRDVYNGFSSHNWKFIEHWAFPGVFPPLTDMKNAIPNKKEENRELFGQRVVALEHLNILLRVFTHKGVLLQSDVEGFTHWANDWYEDSKVALRTILVSGDTYPLDFIVWLRDEIFTQQGDDITKLFGKELKGRLHDFEISVNRK